MMIYGGTIDPQYCCAIEYDYYDIIYYDRDDYQQPRGTSTLIQLIENKDEYLHKYICFSVLMSIYINKKDYQYL